MIDRKTLAADQTTVSYGGRPIVRDLELSIKPGRFTALLGPNGCGKSTLLRAFAGLHRVERGMVVLDGGDIARMDVKSLAREIGILAQSMPVPDGLSVVELVSQGRYPHRSVFGPWRREDDAAVNEALRLTALEDLRDVPVDRLSGGQRQRAWIAMTLAQKSGILLLDEPTTFLDLAHQLEVLGLMRDLVDDNQATVVAVLHDLSQAGRYADWIVLMKDGLILDQGAPAAVLTAENLRIGFGVEVSIFPDPETGAPICLPRRKIDE